MKMILKGLMLGLVMVFVLIGCSQPAKELDAAKAAVQAAIDEGGDVYATQDIENLQADLTSAQSTIDAQGKKLFKSYGESKDMLAQILTKAEELKASIPAKKEEARNAALAAMEKAKAAVEEAKTLLADAPRGKGTKADLEAMNGDIKVLEDMMAEFQTKVEESDYFGAADTARIIEEKATLVSDQIKAAIQKTKKR